MPGRHWPAPAGFPEPGLVSRPYGDVGRRISRRSFVPGGRRKGAHDALDNRGRPCLNKTHPVAAGAGFRPRRGVRLRTAGSRAGAGNRLSGSVLGTPRGPRLRRILGRGARRDPPVRGGDQHHRRDGGGRGACPVRARARGFDQLSRLGPEEHPRHALRPLRGGRDDRSRTHGRGSGHGRRPGSPPDRETGAGARSRHRARPGSITRRRTRGTTSRTRRPAAPRSPARTTSTATGTSTRRARSSNSSRSRTSTTRSRPTSRSRSDSRTGTGGSTASRATRPGRATSPTT